MRSKEQEIEKTEDDFFSGGEENIHADKVENPSGVAKKITDSLERRASSLSFSYSSVFDENDLPSVELSAIFKGNLQNKV